MSTNIFTQIKSKNIFTQIKEYYSAPSALIRPALETPMYLLCHTIVRIMFNKLADCEHAAYKSRSKVLPYMLAIAHCVNILLSLAFTAPLLAEFVLNTFITGALDSLTKLFYTRPDNQIGTPHN